MLANLVFPTARLVANLCVCVTPVVPRNAVISTAYRAVLFPKSGTHAAQGSACHVHMRLNCADGS